MIATAPSTGIEIDNIGPIEHLSLAAHPGTITVLRANNGCGKSTALEAIAALTHGGSKLESRDGTVGGTASGFGVTIKVGRGGANRRSGDLTVDVVEDRIRISEFVDPPVKEPVAADARRLKALVSLVGLVAQPELFHELAGGKEAFDLIVRPETLKATDPIALAEGIKRDLEAASRIQNTKAERLFGEMQAKVASMDGLDLTAECDGDRLQAALELALNDLAKLQQRKLDADSEQDRRRQAQRSLDEATASHTGPTVAEARRAVDAAESARDAARRVVEGQQSAVDVIRDQLRDAELALSQRRGDLNARESDVLMAKRAVADAERHNVTVATWQQTLADHAVATAPTEAEIAHAVGVVKVARLANENGVLIRAAKQRQSEAAQLDEDRKQAVMRCESLRNAAKSVLDVLASSVKSLVPGLVIDNEFRIRVPHAIRGECYYADLSHGERWKLALDIAVANFKRLGVPGILPIPQEAWEGLDGRNRRLIADHVAETDLIVFTAEAERSMDGVSNGLRAEVLE